jgi:hypothetical protein
MTQSKTSTFPSAEQRAAFEAEHYPRPALFSGATLQRVFFAEKTVSRPDVTTPAPFDGQ